MTRTIRALRGGAAVACALALAACAASSGDADPRGGGAGAAGTSGAAGTGSAQGNFDAGASTGAAGTGGALPAEQEVESSFEVPVATGRFVWVANPTSGRVAYVDAAGLTVRTVEAGNGPTYLAAVPGAADAVVVLNVLSNDATFLRVSGTTLESRTYANLAGGSNSWAVSPDGRFAIAWTDARRLPAAPKTRGFHEVTILDLTAPPSAAASATIAVGYRPVSFAFAADSKRAFAVTEDGVSVIALPERAIVATVPLGDHGVTDFADTRDVSITADGRLALVRRDGRPEVALVELATGTRSTVAMASPVTDVDVSGDGAVAVAVARDAAEVAVVPLAGAAAVTRLNVAGETIGQVTITASGKTALLYSNAVAAERLTVLTLDGVPATRAVKLHGSVLSALPTADGKFAVVLHPSEPPAPVSAALDGGADAGSTAPPSTPIANAFSLVALDGTRPARIEMTDAPLRAIALAPASDRVLLTVRDDARKVYGVYLGRLPALSVERYPLASPPLATGVLAGANRGYVAQQHPEGRITFLTLDSGEARTLTGYELGARVVDWSSR